MTMFSLKKVKDESTFFDLFFIDMSWKMMVGHVMKRFALVYRNYAVEYTRHSDF